MSTKSIVRIAQLWYGRHLPLHFDGSFVNFVVKSTSIVRVIADAPIFIDKQSSFAYTDGKSVFLPSMYFNPNLYTELMEAEKEQATAMATVVINGSTIHEGLHILLSDCDVLERCKLNERAYELIQKSEGFAVLINLVEDFYIETYGREFYSQISKFVDGKNEALFNDFLWAQATAEFEVTKDPMHLTELLGFYKRVSIRENEFYDSIDGLRDLLDSACDHLVSKEQRLQIALDLYDLIMKSSEANPESKFNATPELDVQMMGNVGSIEEEMKAGLEDKMITANIAEGKKVESELTAQLKKLLSDAEKTSLQKIEEMFRVPDTLFVDIISSIHSEGLIERSKDFQKFGTYLRYMRDIKHSLGQPRDTGSRIQKQRLHRIATDNKVLGYMDATKMSRGKPKVILLLDASGSMGHGMHSLWNKVAIAGYGAFESMVKAGIPCATYAHTSLSHDGREHPVVYGITSFQMPFGVSSRTRNTGDVARRFGKLSRLSLQENYDGYAVDLVSKAFPTTPGSRVLIVLSDGQPSAGNGYRGIDAMRHTKEIVKQVRDSGIMLLAMSLTEHVVESNDEIYGPQFNIKAYGSLLESSIRNVIQKLSITS